MRDDLEVPLKLLVCCVETTFAREEWAPERGPPCWGCPKKSHLMQSQLSSEHHRCVIAESEACNPEPTLSHQEVIIRKLLCATGHTRQLAVYPGTKKVQIRKHHVQRRVNNFAITLILCPECQMIEQVSQHPGPHREGHRRVAQKSCTAPLNAS